MKKIISFLLLSLLLIIAAGCSPSQEVNEEDVVRGEDLIDSKLLDSCDKMCVGSCSSEYEITDKDEMAVICDSLKNAKFKCVPYSEQIPADGAPHITLFCGDEELHMNISGNIICIKTSSFNHSAYYDDYCKSIYNAVSPIVNKYLYSTEQ